MGLSVRLFAPDGLIWNTAVQEVVLPTTTGQIGLLEGHAPLITALEIGVLRIKVDQTWKPILTLGGLATVKNDEVTILVSGIEEVTKKSYEEVQNILKQATEDLAVAQTVKEKIEASQNLKRAVARLQAYQFLN
jgi:F-type H+-transporting ATPase subunit epsilon